MDGFNVDRNSVRCQNGDLGRVGASPCTPVVQDLPLVYKHWSARCQKASANAQEVQRIGTGRDPRTQWAS